MKLIKLLMLGAVVGALTLAVNKAEAFPLQLKSISGTISATPDDNVVFNTNKTHYITKSFNLKTVMVMVSNTLVQLGSNTPPADAYIAYNPYPNEVTYLTNKTGYYQQLSSPGLGGGYEVKLEIEDMAAAFSINGNGDINENDTLDMFMVFDLLGTDGGEYYASANYGIGKVHFAENANKATMTISGGKGADEGIINSSDHGTSVLNFVFSGSTDQAEWEGPFYNWWYD